MSKNLYNNILRSYKKIEQQSSKNWFILNQFFLTKKFRPRKDILYNIAKNAGSISSGFFILYFLTKTKIET